MYIIVGEMLEVVLLLCLGVYVIDLVWLVLCW